MQLFFRSSYHFFLLAAFAGSVMMAWHILCFIKNVNPYNPGADIMLAGIAGFIWCLSLLGAWIAEGHIK